MVTARSMCLIDDCGFQPKTLCLHESGGASELVVELSARRRKIEQLKEACTEDWLQRGSTKLPKAGSVWRFLMFPSAVVLIDMFAEFILLIVAR